MKKFSNAQQKVIDTVKASIQKFAGKTYEEVYARKEDRTSYTEWIYEMAQQNFYMVYAPKATIDSLVKKGTVETFGKYSLGCQLVKLVDNTKPTTKAEAIKAMDDDAEDPSVTLDEFIAKAQEINNMKEEDTMETIEFSKPQTFERANGRAPITLIRAERMRPTDKWHFVDDDHATWYRKPEWDNEENAMAFYMPDSVRGQEIQMPTEAYEALTTTTNDEEEDTTMETTTTTLNMKDGTVRFELNGITYKYTIDSKRYAKTTPDGKTVRIGKAEYDTNWAIYEQAILDNQPSRVEVENDLDKPAVLNENGLVDCSKCNCDKCVHRNCMRRNPRNVGGLGECPRLDNGIVSEAQKMAEETGMELAEAELAVNVQNEQKKARKARKSKDIAYEGHGKTLTAKQVDFLKELVETDGWDGFDSPVWTDVLCDEIGGQFAGKPMTVGAMISTLCEKGLAERSKGDFTDPVTGRTRKSTYMAFTGLGEEIAKELGL